MIKSIMQLYNFFIFVNLKAKIKANGMNIKHRLIGTRKTGPPIVTLLGIIATNKEEIMASFLL